MRPPPVLPIADAATLADELGRFRVVELTRVAELTARFRGGTAAALAEHLVRTGALTAFQAQRALAGEARLLVLGPYRMTGTPGCGTFGPLFTATHNSKPGLFNVRVLPLRNVWKAWQAKQLARTLAASVTHPAVAPLVEVDSANGYHYLVWPDVAGERLADVVGASGPLTGESAAELIGRLAGALAACHARSATHGALTPHAVAITPGGAPRLLELGAGALLAQSIADDESLLDSLSAAFASAAVLTFAAPELARDPQTLTAAADQYALGSVGYFAVTGLSPYPHPTLAEQLRAKRAGAPPSAAVVNPAISADLAAVLERMMAPKPADRFASLAEVESRLAAAAKAAPVAAGPPPFRAPDAQRGPVAATGPELTRPPARDDSAASVTFDLPEPPETVAEASGEASDRANVETPAEPFPARLAPPAPKRPAPPGGAREPKSPPAPTPVPGHTAGPAGAPPAGGSALWKRLKRSLLFWQSATDPVQVSVFGPAAVAPGQTVELTVVLHRPEAAGSVRTLARAFHHDDELVGTGELGCEVSRQTELAVHLSVSNAAVAKALVKFPWRGQPHRLGFELYVPWESPEGAASGLVSVGLNAALIGQIEFRLNVLPRRA